MPGKDNVRVSVLNLCDLAGSEDRSKTLAVGKAAEEGPCSTSLRHSSQAEP